jgi:hypothetical protein
MPRKFEGMQCVFCPNPSSKIGEHVLPRWLLERFSESEGPYTLLRNGQPVLTKRGDPRTQASIGSITLPVCETCNAMLNRRFEEPAKDVVRRLLE